MKIFIILLISLPVFADIGNCPVNPNGINELIEETSPGVFSSLCDVEEEEQRIKIVNTPIVSGEIVKRASLNLKFSALKTQNSNISIIAEGEFINSGLLNNNFLNIKNSMVDDAKSRGWIDSDIDEIGNYLTLGNVDTKIINAQDLNNNFNYLFEMSTLTSGNSICNAVNSLLVPTLDLTNSSSVGGVFPNCFIDSCQSNYEVDNLGESCEVSFIDTSVTMVVTRDESGNVTSSSTPVDLSILQQNSNIVFDNDSGTSCSNNSVGYFSSNTSIGFNDLSNENDYNISTAQVGCSQIAINPPLIENKLTVDGFFDFNKTGSEVIVFKILAEGNHVGNLNINIAYVDDMELLDIVSDIIVTRGEDGTSFTETPKPTIDLSTLLGTPNITFKSNDNVYGCQFSQQYSITFGEETPIHFLENPNFQSGWTETCYSSPNDNGFVIRGGFGIDSDIDNKKTIFYKLYKGSSITTNIPSIDINEGHYLGKITFNITYVDYYIDESFPNISFTEVPRPVFDDGTFSRVENFDFSPIKSLMDINPNLNLYLYADDWRYYNSDTCLVPNVIYSESELSQLNYSLGLKSKQLNGHNVDWGTELSRDGDELILENLYFGVGSSGLEWGLDYREKVLAYILAEDTVDCLNISPSYISLTWEEYQIPQINLEFNILGSNNATSSNIENDIQVSGIDISEVQIWQGVDCSGTIEYPWNSIPNNLQIYDTENINYYSMKARNSFNEESSCENVSITYSREQVELDLELSLKYPQFNLYTASTSIQINAVNNGDEVQVWSSNNCSGLINRVWNRSINSVDVYSLNNTNDFSAMARNSFGDMSLCKTFQMEHNNEDPTVSIVSPVENDTLTGTEFNIDFVISDYTKIDYVNVTINQGDNYYKEFQSYELDSNSINLIAPSFQGTNDELSIYVRHKNGKAVTASVNFDSEGSLIYPLAVGTLVGPDAQTVVVGNQIMPSSYTIQLRYVIFYFGGIQNPDQATYHLNDNTCSLSSKITHALSFSEYTASIAAQQPTIYYNLNDPRIAFQANSSRIYFYGEKYNSINRYFVPTNMPSRLYVKEYESDGVTPMTTCSDNYLEMQF
jgi:hypothetical protein